MSYYTATSLNDWVGKILIDIQYIDGNDVIIFTFEDSEYKMYHSQDCCENVYVESITGDLKDLIGSPLTLAEEVVSSEDDKPISDYDESFTWTFYKFATINGYVDIRWYGSSNGYYSESVNVYKTS